MSYAFQQVIINILQVSVVPLLGMIATALGTIWVQKIKLQSQKIKDNDWETVKKFAQIAVMSSEQQFKAGFITKEQRKPHALEVLKAKIESAKIKNPNDDYLLSELIEAQVWDMSNPTEGEK